MPEQSRGKNARRAKPAPSPPAPKPTDESPSVERQTPAPLPLETSRRQPVRRSAVNASTLRDQPAVAYALAFALLALLLICAFSIYLAAN